MNLFIENAYYIIYTELKHMVTLEIFIIIMLHQEFNIFFYELIYSIESSLEMFICVMIVIYNEKGLLEKEF